MSYKSEREIISTTDKLSAVAAGLEPNTKYQFHVHAINGVKGKGQFGPSAKSKTKFSQNVWKAAAEAAGLDAVSLPDGAVNKFKRVFKKGRGRKSLTNKDQFELSSTETDPFLARRHAGAGHKTTLPKVLPMT